MGFRKVGDPLDLSVLYVGFVLWWSAIPNSDMCFILLDYLTTRYIT